MSSPAPVTSKQFKLDQSILGINASETIDLSTSTDFDVLQALTSPNAPFPVRDNGEIALGRIGLSASAGRDITFDADGAQVKFSTSGGVHAGAGVYDDSKKAVAALALGDAPDGFEVKIGPADRYVVMQWGWNADVKIDGKHPLGALGSLTFGAEVKNDRVYAVIHGIDAGTFAQAALAETISSFRLPRHLAKKALKDQLAPRTWLIAETDGSIAASIGAKLGYDFKFSRDARLLGVTRQLSARIDAGVDATFGFNVSGHYLLVAGRESSDEKLRLRLFRQSRRSTDFGLNLKAGIQNTTPLPANADDFIKGVTGVHGLQVMKDLLLLEEWITKNADLSQTAARLINKTGLDLLQKVTGFPDVASRFDEAKDKVLNLVKQWNALPEKVAASTWTSLEKLGDVEVIAFRDFLGNLSSDNPDDATRAIMDVIQQVTFGDTAAGRFLGAIADQGLLALTEQLEVVRRSAKQLNDVLDGDLLRRLQSFINEKLNLDTVLKFVNKADFDSLGEWIIPRLSDFLDEKLGFADLEKIQSTIRALLATRQKAYEQLKKAASARYGAELAAHYQRSSANTALLDVEFDLSDTKSDSFALFKEVVQDCKLDNLFLKPAKGVVLNKGVLSHETSRNASVDIHLPHWSREQQSITESVASLKAEGDGDRVLIYEVNASDTVTVANRFKSQMAVLAGIQRVDGGFVVSDGSVSYELRQAKENMNFADLEHTVTPFVITYLSQLFGGQAASIHTFLFDLDRTVERKLNNGSNEFGDVLLSMQVAAPAGILTAWFKERTDDQIRSDMMNVSRHLQVKLRHILPFYYFQDMNNLLQNPPAAALLVWSSLPVSTSVSRSLVDGRLTFNTDKDTFWDFASLDMRRAMAADAHTTRSLASNLAPLQERLREAGEGRSRDFDASEASAFQSLTRSDRGAGLYASLLIMEESVISGVEKTLKEIQKFIRNNDAASASIPALADFGAKLVRSFHKDLGVYGGNAMRPLGTMLLAETAAALDGSTDPSNKRAVLSLAVLNETRTFRIGDFVGGATPPSEEIAITQTLVST